MNKRYVITNKKRFYTFITTTLFLLLTLMAILASQASHSQKQIYYNEYRVGAGDTLWEISRHYSEDDIDIRQFIYEIKRLNQMKTSAIYEGDIIKIPIDF